MHGSQATERRDFMDDEYIKALKDLIMTFVDLSDEWLENNIINQETYLEITKKKKEFTNKVGEIETKQG